MGYFLRLDTQAAGRVAANHGGQAVKAAAELTAERARQNVARAGRVNTGALMRSIQARPAGPFQWTVGSPLPYATFQEFGVKGPIYPKRAKVLRFKPKGSSTYIFRPMVKGFPGAHFLGDAHKALRPRDFIP